MLKLACLLTACTCGPKFAPVCAALVLSFVPRGKPGLAKFAIEVNDHSKPRFKIEVSRGSTMEIVKSLPALFEDYIQEWKEFFDNFSRSVGDIPDVPAQSLAHVAIDDIPPCALRLPSHASLAKHQYSLCESSVAWITLLAELPPSTFFMDCRAPL
eukprot:3592489-Pleurochrysis_carterae.AAC.2